MSGNEHSPPTITLTMLSTDNSGMDSGNPVHSEDSWPQGKQVLRELISTDQYHKHKISLEEFEGGGGTLRVVLV